MKPQPFLVFFPPRLISPDLTAGDTDDVMDKARDIYLEKGVCLVDQEGAKDAMKILSYSRLFPEICNAD